MMLDRLTQWRDRSLANLFALSSASIAALSVLTTALFSIGILYWMELQGQRSELIHKGTITADRIEQSVLLMETVLTDLAHSAMASTALLDASGRDAYVRPYMQHFSLPVSATSSIALCDINGRLLAGTLNITECYGDSAEFRQVLRDGHSQRRVTLDAAGRRYWTVFHGITFAYTGTTEGVAIARFDLDGLLSLLPGELGLASVGLDTGGDSAALTVNRENSLLVPILVKSPATSGPLTLRITLNPQSIWEKFLPLVGGYLMVTLMLIIASLFWAKRASARITRPLISLRNHAREIAETGSLSLPIPQAGSDEVGQLANSMSTMIGNLQTATHAQRESEARFRLIFDKSEEAILFSQPDGSVEAANFAACRLFGHSEEDFVRLGRAGVMDTTDPRLPEALLERQTNGSFRGELRCCHANGHVFPVEVVSTLFQDAHGTIRSSNLFRDISERLRHEEVLRQSESRFRGYFELGLVGMGITSPDKGWIDANDQLCSILGYSRDELFTKTWAELTHPDDLSAELVEFNRVLNQESDGGTIDKRYIAKDGRIVWTTMSAKCLRKADGSVDYFVVMVQDITKQHAAERDRLEDAERLSKLSRHLVSVQEDARRRLARELHDNTSPTLAAIGINLEVSEIARNEKNWDELAMRMQDTRALIEAAGLSIRDVCSELRPPVLDYAGLIPALEAYADQYSRRTGIAVNFERAEQTIRLPPETESTLFRIAQEALTNSAKHSRATKVVLSLSIGIGGILLSVLDDGQGFAPDGLGNHIGLGLINMREMAEFISGSFSINSASGGGTSIQVVIEGGGTQS